MWIIFALTASILWGLDYTLTESVLKKISFPTLLSIELFFGFVSMLVIAIIFKTYKPDFLVIMSSRKIFWTVVVIVLSFIIANTLIVLSINGKNATLSGLIEISYPLFIVFFSWLILKENNLNFGTSIGATLIFIGTSLIYFFSR